MSIIRRRIGQASLALTAAILVASCGNSTTSNAGPDSADVAIVTFTTSTAPSDSTPPDQLASDDGPSPSTTRVERPTTTATTEVAFATPRQTEAIAETFLLDPSCAAELFSESTEADLNQIGFADDETAPNAMQRSIADVNHPTFEPLMLSFAQCAEHFAELMTEDYGPRVPPATLSCMIDTASTEADTIALVVIGTTTGSTESFSPSWVDFLETGGERLLEIAASCSETV